MLRCLKRTFLGRLRNVVRVKKPYIDYIPYPFPRHLAALEEIAHLSGITVTELLENSLKDYLPKEPLKE